MSRRDWLEQLLAATTRLVHDLREHDELALRPLRADIGDLRARVARELEAARLDRPRLLVFVCGTTLMHAGAVGRSRDERVCQARKGTDPTLRDYGAYVATEGALEKLRGWSAQGAEISYLSVHRDAATVTASAGALRSHGFPPGPVLSRSDGESYGDVVRRAAPDILIEGDRTSSDADGIAYHQLEPTQRDRILSIVVPQYGGLEHLPASLGTLLGSSA